MPRLHQLVYSRISNGVLDEALTRPLWNNYAHWVHGYESEQIRVYNYGKLRIRFLSTDDTFSDIYTLFPPFDEDWLHFVVTWRPCYGLKLYMNGTRVDDGHSPSDGVIPTQAKTYFVSGAEFCHGCPYTDMYEMTLDELHVWDAEMSDEEVLAMYTVDAGLNWLTGNSLVYAIIQQRLNILQKLLQHSVSNISNWLKRSTWSHTFNQFLKSFCLCAVDFSS